ncbi:SCO family protein [Sphingobium phenoxybenzoativorans]|uniref:SCO family protein n=1 Tax=Sphingobium phenoxybenzoativorans TaxID=1592790 RepID=UPI000ACF948C|nr:SCO family protein [Sphingobium phenoxybenzoativorans]
MAGFAMNKALISLVSPLLLALSACGGGDQSSFEQGALAGASIGAPFTLTDQDGKRVAWDSFKGKYRLVYFGYTYCPDVCPVDLQRITQAYGKFEKDSPDRAAKLQPIFITVDPQRDTPPVLKNYVAAFSPRLIGLTGTPDEIAKVAKDFVVIYGKADEKDANDYLVSHSRTPYLFGPDGQPIALVPVDDPGTKEDEGSPDAVLAALDHWVK